MKKVFTVLIMVLIVSGCSRQSIDFDSSEKMKESIQKMHDSLLAEEQQKFDTAIQALMMYDIRSFADFAMVTEESIVENLKKKVDGKSAKQIIEMYNLLSDDDKNRLSDLGKLVN